MDRDLLVEGSILHYLRQRGSLDIVDLVFCTRERPNSVRRSVEDLLTAGQIEIVHEPGTPSVYRITKPPSRWRRWRDKKKQGASS